MPRTRIPLAFGQGLDRETGIMAVRPGSMEYLKNLILYEGKAQIRRGLYNTATLPAEDGNPCTAVVLVVALRSEQGGLIVGYYAASGKIVVFRTDSSGTSPSRIGVPPDWNYAADSAAPKLIGVNIGTRVFIAHAELDYTVRQDTFFYDGLGTGQLITLEATLDTAGQKPVKFIGVTRYLSYLIGWGWAGPDSPERTEFLRTNVPDESPTTLVGTVNPDFFNAEHYALAGGRDEAVFRCESGSSSLVVLKEHETYEFSGYSRQTFTIQPLDPQFGVSAPRLAVNIKGQIFGWSAEGPRLWQSGAPSIDLALPLGLGGPDPSDLVAAGATADGFACYHPFWRCVLFVFGKRIYCLSIRESDPSLWKWSYFETAIELSCGGVLLSSSTPALTAPTGYPSCSGLDTAGDYVLYVTFANSGQTGGEVCEAWVKPSGGSWYLANAVPVLTTAPTQTMPIGGLTANTSYDVAFRYRRGGLFAADYQGATPDDWSAIAANPGRVCTGLTTTNDTRTIVATWSRTSSTAEGIHLVISGGDGTVDTVWEHSLTATSGFGGGATIPAAPSPVSDDFDITDPDATDEEVWHYFRAQASGASAWGPTAECWMGPQWPLGATYWLVFNGDVTIYNAVSGGAPGVFYNDSYTDDGLGNVATDSAHADFTAVWANANAAYETELWLSQDGGAYALAGTAVAGAQYLRVAVERGHSYTAKIRHKFTSFTVDDWSDYTAASAALTVPTL